MCVFLLRKGSLSIRAVSSCKIQNNCDSWLALMRLYCIFTIFILGMGLEE